MSTSILYHCFGITARGIRHVHSRFENGRTIFRIRQDHATLACSVCGSRRSAKRFERYVQDLCKHMTMSAVAHHLGISWPTVKDIQKRYLQRQTYGYRDKFLLCLVSTLFTLRDLS